MFEHILDWKLLAGTHEFPGPHGGTCINEAAIIAAGFPYKPVEGWYDCPPCFSPVLSAFAIGVNDTLDNNQRQKLMPLVLKLSGSRDADWVELARLRFLISSLEDAHMSQALNGMPSRLDPLLGLTKDAWNELVTVLGRVPAPDPSWLGGSATTLGRVVAQVNRMTGLFRLAIPTPVREAFSIKSYPSEETFQMTQIGPGYFPGIARVALERAFLIGKQAPAEDTALIAQAAERLKKARETAPA